MARVEPPSAIAFGGSSTHAEETRKATTITDTSIRSYFAQLANWLEMESVAEAERLAERRRRITARDAEKSGESLVDLSILDHDKGLAGRHLLTFVKRNRDLPLPWNRLRVGSPVILSPHEDGSGEGFLLQAVVSRRTGDAIQLALDEWPSGSHFRIDLSPDEITRRRQAKALATVETATGRLGTLRKIVLGQRPPKFHAQPITTFFGSLNPSQQDAVRFAMSASDLAIIHGPPGTGKTTTVIEVIRQAVAIGQSVLACAPSNTAADNLLEALVAVGVNVVRLGHPARVMESLRDHTVDLRMDAHDTKRVIEEMIREAEGLFRQADRYTRAQPQRGARQETRREARRLLADARQLERQVVQHILDSAEVICCTTSVDEQVLGKRTFDLAVIDEACQSTQPESWVPMLYAYRVVLAGDHCQLPATIVSTEAARNGFAVSLQQRLVAQYGDLVTRRLTVQYRMHTEIMTFSSRRFYDDSLTADESVAEHRLVDLPGVASTPLTETPVLFIDTAGAGWEEELEPEGESRRNPEEACLVIRHITQLIEAGVAGRDVAVIAPYAAQVRLLRELAVDRTVEIDTVDGFQGREKEAVIISLVRSNASGEIGFLADTRRMNVALTRARRKLIVIGDSATLANHEFYCELFEYFESINAYQSVWTLPDAIV